MSDDLERWLHLLAHPVRRHILWLAWDSPVPASDLAAEFAIAPNTVSTHLAKLAEAGFLTVEVRGTSRLYRTDAARVGKVHAALDEAFGYRLTDRRPFGTGMRAAPVAGPVLAVLRSPPYRNGPEEAWLDLASADGLRALLPRSRITGELSPLRVLRIRHGGVESVLRCHRRGPAGVTVSWAWGSGVTPLPPGVTSLMVTQEQEERRRCLVVRQRCFDDRVVEATAPWLEALLGQAAAALDTRSR